MKKKKIVIITLIITITLIFISLFILNTIKNNKLREENIEIINTNYQELSTNVEEYNNIRTKLEGLLNNFIYNDYKNKHEEYINILTEYNNNIKKIDNNIKNIDTRCNLIYKDKTVNKICNNYKITYEKLINIYITDLTNYNNKITSYNEYKKDTIKLFELVHNNYIDYNKDNVYEGRSTNEREEN